MLKDRKGFLSGWDVFLVANMNCKRFGKLGHNWGTFGHQNRKNRVRVLLLAR